MTVSRLTNSENEALATWLTTLNPESGASALTMSRNEMFANIWNQLDSEAGASHLNHSEGELLAGILNALDGDADVSHLTHSASELLAGIVNALDPEANVSPLTTSVAELFALLGAGGPAEEPIVVGDIEDLEAPIDGTTVTLLFTSATNAISHQYRNGVLDPPTDGAWQALPPSSEIEVTPDGAILYFQVRGVGEGDTFGDPSNVSSVATPYDAILAESTLAADGANSWWERNAIKQSLRNSVAFGYMVAGSTDQIVGRLDLPTGLVDSTFTVNSTFGVDDHSAPTVEEFPNGQLCCAYTGHNETTDVKYRISSDGDPANLGAAVTCITTPATNSYAQLYIHGTDTIFVLTRNSTTNWDIAKSTNKGTNWTRKKRLVTISGMPTADQVYIQTGRVDADNLRCFVIPHPTNVQNVLRVFNLNLSTGVMSDDAGTIGTIEDGTNDTALSAFADLPAIRTPAASRSQRLLDVRDDGGAILLADFVTATGSDLKYYIGRLTGANYYTAAHWTFNEICDAGAMFASATLYPGGATFDRVSPTDSIFLCRESGPIHSGAWILERRTTADSWATNSVASQIKVRSAKTVRPVSPRGAVEGVGRVMWQEGSEAVANAYTDFSVWSLALKTGPGEWISQAYSEAEATAYIATLTGSPSARYQQYIHELFHRWKTGYLSGSSFLASFKGFYILGGLNEADSRRDLISLGQATVAAGTPVWTANRGVSLPTTAYLSTGYNPRTQSDPTDQGWLYARVLSNNQYGSCFGANDATNLSIILPRSTADGASVRINATASSTATNGTITDARGGHLVNRTTAPVTSLRTNGASVTLANSTQAAANTPNAAILIGRAAAGTAQLQTIDFFCAGHGTVSVSGNPGIDLERSVAVLHAQLLAL
jgi:hypothetical protein